MPKYGSHFLVMALAVSLAISACGKTESAPTLVKDEPVANTPVAAETPTLPANPTGAVVAPAAQQVDAKPAIVKIAWSYYTSWSWFAAAEDFGLVNGAEGAQGSLETKYNVDIVLQRAEYLDTLNLYAAGTVDAVFVTNTDILGFAEVRKTKVGDVSVAASETSHSFGADQIIAEKTIKNWADLKGVPVKGAEGSVTQYLFWRGCQENKVNYDEYKFENVDPVIGAPQFVGRTAGFRAFGGWSPETFTVLDGRTDVHALFTSANITRYEITDMFVIGQSAIDRGGAGAIKVVAEALTEMNKKFADPTTKDAVLKAFAKRFNDHKVEYLTRALDLTPVASPTKDSSILTKPEFRATMPKIAEFAKSHKLCEGDVPFAWGTKNETPTSVLRFDVSYLP